MNDPSTDKIIGIIAIILVAVYLVYQYTRPPKCNEYDYTCQQYYEDQAQQPW